MVTVKVKFRAAKEESEKGTLFFQVIQDRVVKQFNTNCKLSIEDWNSKHSRIKMSQVIVRKDVDLLNTWDMVRFELKRLECVIKHNEETQKACTLDDIVDAHIKIFKRNTLYGFGLETIGKLKLFGNIANANIYFSTLVSFMTFLKGKNMELKDLGSDVLEAYEAFLKHKENGTALNTIACYMRTLRALYNRAVENKLAPDKNLFKRVRTTIEKTPKRAIPLEYITRLKNAALDEHPELELARNLFLFSFYTRGMSFVDIAYLKKKEIKNGEFTYRRSKTGQAIRVGWEQCMEDLVRKHTLEHSDYLFPIITNLNKDARIQYIVMRNKVNANLKKIAAMIHIPHNLTMYVARHTWASAAKAKNISISVISEAMGHDSEATTRIYLASLDTAVIDDANRLIIGSV